MAPEPDDTAGGAPGTDSPPAPYQSLYRRFRPGTFGEVRGQDHVVLALRNAVRDGRVGHAYLFSGPRGTGKTSTARILAKALNCTDLRDGEPCGVCSSCVEITRGTSLDVHELDAASNNGVEAMRDLVSRAALGTPGRQKVYIVDEVHMLSTAASNALLKTLEEPPAHVVFVLATTDPQKVLPTIRSRTQHFEFHLLGADTLEALLNQVRQDAGLVLPEHAVDVAVRRGRGSARDALSVLDQVAAANAVDDDLPSLGEIVDALAERDPARALVAVAQLVAAGWAPQQLAGDLVDHLRQGFLGLVAPQLADAVGEERTAVAGGASALGLAGVVRAIEAVGRAQMTMRDAPDPRVHLEVALIRLARPEVDDGPDALLARLERLERAVGSWSPAGGGLATAGSPPATPPLPEPVTASSPPGTPGSTPPEPTAGRVGPVAPGGSTAGGARATVGALRRARTVPTTAPADPVPPPTGMGPAAAVPAEAARPGGEVVPGGGEVAASAPGGGEALGGAPGGTASTAVDRDGLVEAWGDHIYGRLRPKAKALYQAGRFVATEEDRAVFALPNATHRARCEEVRSDVEAVISEYFGHAVHLVLVIDDAPGDHGTGGDAPGDRAEGRGTGDRGVGDRAGGRGTGDRGAGPGDPGDDSGSDPAPGPEPGPGGRRLSPSPEPRPSPGEGDHPSSPVTVTVSGSDDDAEPFDEIRTAPVVDVDDSVAARLLRAFPGAEEVS